MLFSAYHRRILALLLLHPERSIYVREIARLTEVPAGSVHRKLRRLAESGLLVRESVGNQVRYHRQRGSDLRIRPGVHRPGNQSRGDADR